MLPNYKNTDTQNIAMLIAKRINKPIDVRWMSIEGTTVHPDGKIEWVAYFDNVIYVVVKHDDVWYIESTEDVIVTQQTDAEGVQLFTEAFTPKIETKEIDEDVHNG